MKKRLLPILLAVLTIQLAPTEIVLSRPLNGAEAGVVDILLFPSRCVKFVCNGLIWAATIGGTYVIVTVGYNVVQFANGHPESCTSGDMQEVPGAGAKKFSIEEQYNLNLQFSAVAQNLTATPCSVGEVTTPFAIPFLQTQDPSSLDLAFGPAESATTQITVRKIATPTAFKYQIVDPSGVTINLVPINGDLEAAAVSWESGGSTQIIGYFEKDKQSGQKVLKDTVGNVLMSIGETPPINPADMLKMAQANPNELDDFFTNYVGKHLVRKIIKLETFFITLPEATPETRQLNPKFALAMGSIFLREADLAKSSENAQ